jgi:Xaa-Pro aminopeptidase
VEALRQAKDPEEVDAIRAAAALALEALEAVLPTVRIGESERSLAARLEAELRRRGSEWHPFQTIVASGPRSAQPHARTSGRAIGAGELLLLDFGAIVDGYCSDLTRTVVVGSAPDELQQERYAAVRVAQQAGIAGLRPGISGREADAAARSSLEQAGLDAAFRHSLGHGIGLEIHEDPRLAPTAEGLVAAGAVVTVEPGVYFEGWGGIRLEDDVLLTAHGPALLSPGAPAMRAVP